MKNVELYWQEEEVVVDDEITALDWRVEKLVGACAPSAEVGNRRRVDRCSWREDELVFESGSRCSQAATSRSSADLLWMIKVEPLSSTMSFFLNSANVRVIVSRLVPVS